MMIAAMTVGKKIAPWNGPKLFTGEVQLTAVIVLAVVVGFILAALVFAAMRERRLKDRAGRTAGFGRPKDLLDEVAAVAELTLSEKRLLIKLADRLELLQPVSIVICPLLLVRAAEHWQATHKLGPAKQWGVKKLNDIALKVHNTDLTQLAA